MSKTTIPRGGITADAIDATLIADDAISEEHLDATAITGHTALAETPADTDEFLISDGGVLKRIDASYVGSSPLIKIASASDDTSHGGVNLNSIFSSTYENYLVIGDLTNTGASDNLKMQMRDSNGMRTASEYAYRIQVYDHSNDTATTNIRNTGTTSFQLSDNLEVLELEFYTMQQFVMTLQMCYHFKVLYNTKQRKHLQV